MLAGALKSRVIQHFKDPHSGCRCKFVISMILPVVEMGAFLPYNIVEMSVYYICDFTCC